MILERQEKHLSSLANIRYRLSEVSRVLYTQPPQLIAKNPNEPADQVSIINVQNNLDAEDKLIEQIEARLCNIEEQLGLLPVVTGGQQLGKAAR